MAIKNKDGSVYKLRGPNPLMKEQDRWNLKKTKIYNLGQGETEVVEYEDKKKKEFEESLIKIDEERGLKEETQVVYPDEFFAEIQKPEPEEVIEIPIEVVEEPTPEPKEEIVEEPEEDVPEPKEDEKISINLDPEAARILKERSSVFFCVPKTGEMTHVDDLYGETYSTDKYGSKFLFDAVVVDESDLEMKIWSVKELSKGSIIRRKAKEARWWKVSDIEPQDTGGHLSRLITSDVNPSFS